MAAPLAYEIGTALNHDDFVGLVQGPIYGCFPASGPVAYDIKASESGPRVGLLKIEPSLADERDPICPPPSFSIYLDGPTSGPAYSAVTVSAIASNYVNPIDYFWTVNGSPACSNTSTCTANLGSEGSYTTFAVEATDGAGSVASASLTVLAEYGGCTGCLSPGRAPTASDSGRADSLRAERTRTFGKGDRLR
jgi:hypothetical protein